MGLYIHIPFCGSICSYCHFSRTAHHSWAVRSRYVEAVLREFELRWRACTSLRGSRLLQTAYVGGGTPSLLEPDLMQRLLAGTVGRLSPAETFELTCEANPESLDEAKAKVWNAAGVNRISLGVQSLDPVVLKMLGRRCAPEQARQALKLACRTFERVSADWIIGPGLARDSLFAELLEAIDLGVEHFSLYILERHPGTRLEQEVKEGRVVLLSDKQTESLYLSAVDFLRDLGFYQYEVSNFARPGGESRHNRNYWRRKPWLGLGQAAHGCYGPRRYSNHDQLEAYCQAVEAGRLPEALIDPLSLTARLLERIILALRTTEGVPLSWLADDCLDWEAGKRQGLWNLAEGSLKLTARGFLLIDSIEEAVRPRKSG